MSIPRSRTFSLLVAGAGAVIVLGVSQPWISASSGIFTLERTGFEFGDGKLMAWIGAGILLAGLLAVVAPHRAWLVLATIGGMGAVATGIVDYQDVTGRGSSDVAVSVGFGLYLCIVGAGAAFLFGVLGMQASGDEDGRPTTFLPATFPPPSP